MLPDRCSVTEFKMQCPNPPEFVVSVVIQNDEYMIGVTCDRHRQVVANKTRILQKKAKIPNGKIQFSRLKAVGTDCINADPSDFVQLDTEKLK